jgi:hypothetical protein
MPPKPDANTRRSQAMRRAHNEGRLDGRTQLSDLEMATMLHGGATLEEIAKLAGVSRERVRQRLHRIGVTPSLRIDVVKLMEVVRAQPVDTFAAAAKAAGVSTDAARHAILRLGLFDPVERLFRLRKRAASRSQLQGTLHDLRVLAQQLGRTPTAKDLVEDNRRGGVPSIASIQKQFGSLSAAMTAAGLTPNSVGRKGKG